MTVKNIDITIDGRKLSVQSGKTLLQAATEAGIHIPTMCHHADLCATGLGLKGEDEACGGSCTCGDKAKAAKKITKATAAKATGNCRLCLVEVEGQRTLQASCAFPVTSSVNVKTTSAAIRHARRDILELMMSEHYGECTECRRNQNCELQTLCAEYGVTSERFGRPDAAQYSYEDARNIIQRDMNKCVLCRRCINTCSFYEGVNALTPEGKGEHSKVATFMDTEMMEAWCINCGQCVNRCPTGALTERDDTDAIWAAIEDPDKYVVIQTAPAPRAAIGECFGMEPGTPMTFQMNTALKLCGFDKVFDTNFSADLTILEEGSELISRLYKAVVQKDNSAALPQFTSCSPGWIKFIEHFYPDYLPNLSSAKSPQQMMGAVLKTYFAEKNGWDPSKIVSVSLMPCTAKKFEAARPEMDGSGYRDIDYVVTTREISRMIKQAGIDLPKLEKSNFDSPFGTPTGSGVIFAATGGVMEAALRTVIEVVTGLKVEDVFKDANITPVRGFDGARIAEVKIDKVGPVPAILSKLVPDFNWLKGVTVKVGVAHGTANAMKVMEDIKAGGPFSTCHFIEFMACPGGCLGGGGQPIPTNADIRAARARAIYGEDMDYAVRKSHENKDVLKIYEEFLKDGPCGHKSHKLLHTHYTSRS